MIIDTLSRGETRIRRQIGEFFESVIPGYIDLLVTQNDDLTPDYMPYPKEYLCYDPIDAVSHPTVGAFVSGDHDFRVLEILPGGSTQFEVKYEATIFVSAENANLGVDDENLPIWEGDTVDNYRDAAIRQRDDLLNLVIMAIIDSPSFGTANGEKGFVLEAELTEMRKSTPEPIKISDKRNPRHVATGLVLVNLKCTENTAVQVIGHANEYDVDFDMLDIEI